MNGPVIGRKINRKAQSRTAAPIRSQNPARGCANAAGTLAGAGSSAAATPSPAPAPLLVAGAAAANVADDAPEDGSDGVDGVCRRSRRMRPNMAVTAAPNPHRLVTPSVINPRIGPIDRKS